MATNIKELELTLVVEWGSVRMKALDILGLQPGSVLKFAMPPIEPVSITLNGRPIAKGDPTVVDGGPAVCITSVVPAEQWRAPSGEFLMDRVPY